MITTLTKLMVKIIISDHSTWPAVPVWPRLQWVTSLFDLDFR